MLQPLLVSRERCYCFCHLCVNTSRGASNAWTVPSTLAVVPQPSSAVRELMPDRNFTAELSEHILATRAGPKLSGLKAVASSVSHHSPLIITYSDIHDSSH